VAMLSDLSSALLSRIGTLQRVAEIFCAVRPSLTVHVAAMQSSTGDGVVVSAHTQAMSVGLHVDAGAPAKQVNFQTD
jgi:hypothetical protein